jgi:hypothetical protein
MCRSRRIDGSAILTTDTAARARKAILARDADLAVQCLAAHYRLTAQLCNLPRVH